MTKKNRSMIQRRLIPTYIFLTICSFISVFPLYWMIAAATNSSLNVARGSIAFGNQLAVNFANLSKAVQGTLWSSMGNSFLYSIVQTVVTLFVCSIAGYGFELYHDKGKDKLFGILLLAVLFLFNGLLAAVLKDVVILDIAQLFQEQPGIS